MILRRTRDGPGRGYAASGDSARAQARRARSWSPRRTWARATSRQFCGLDGFNWQRYRVLFDNGGELGDLDHRHLEPVGRTAKRLAKQAKLAAR